MSYLIELLSDSIDLPYGQLKDVDKSIFGNRSYSNSLHLPLFYYQGYTVLI